MKDVQEAAYCLSWLTATIRLSPSNGKSAYSDAILEDKTPQSILFGCDDKRSMYFDISTTELQPLTNGELKMCWTPLLPVCIIADGWPIPKRPEELPGLEIPLDMLTSISGARVPVRLSSEDLVLQGQSTILVPVRMEPVSLGLPRCLRWHLLQQEDGTIATGVLKEYLKKNSEFHRLSDDDIRGLHHVRSFVGWTTPASVCLGAVPNFDYSNLSRCTAKKYKDVTPDEWALKEISLATQIKVPAVANWEMRANFAPNYTLPARRTPRTDLGSAQELKMGFAGGPQLSDSWSQPVFLYDPEGRRAWMVTRGSVILFILRIMTFKRGKNSIPIAEGSDDRADAARTVIERFHDFVVYKEEAGTKVTLREAAHKINIILGKIAANMIKESTSDDLYGWDLISLLDPNGEPLPLHQSLDSRSGGVWPKLCNGHPVLFVDGLGDVIKPRNEAGLCNRWRTVPRGRDYLCASLHALESICGKWRRQGAGHYHWINSGIRWEPYNIMWAQAGQHSAPNLKHRTLKHRAGDSECLTHLQLLIETRGNNMKKAFEAWRSDVHNSMLQDAQLSPDGAVVFGSPKRGILSRLDKLISRKRNRSPSPTPQQPLPTPSQWNPSGLVELVSPDSMPLPDTSICKHHAELSPLRRVARSFTWPPKYHKSLGDILLDKFISSLLFTVIFFAIYFIFLREEIRPLRSMSALQILT